MAPSHWLLSSFWIHQVMGPLIVKGSNADLLLLVTCFTTPITSVASKHTGMRVLSSLLYCARLAYTP